MIYPKNSQKGFTLIEMLVIAPIVILAIGAFLTVIISMTGEVLSSRASNALSYNVQDALNRIEQDVRLSTGFLAETNITLNATDQQGFNNDATKFTNIGLSTGSSLILNMLVTNDNPSSATAGVVYLANQPNACASANVKANKPMTMNVVYFVKDNTLWRRTIMPSPTPTTCSTPWQQASCATGYTTGNLCKTNDIKLVEGITSPDKFGLDYYTNASSTIPNTIVTTDPSKDVRNSAFYSVPTVGVSISASQSVAGRTIERSATVRSTRLESNASLIAPTVQESPPGAPNLSGVYASNETTKFTWPISPGNNVVYDVDYKIVSSDTMAITPQAAQDAAINAIPWVNASTGTTNTSFTRTANRSETVFAQIRARNTAGTTSYTSTSVKIPLWSPLVLQNTWSNYVSLYPSASFTRTSAGLVVLQGLIQRASAAPSGETIAILPEGYRPSAMSMYPVHINGGAGWLYIYPSGVIESISVNSGWTSLNGITFVASDAGSAPIPITLTAPWVYYGGVHPTPAIILDGLGRVNMQGLIKGGSAGSVVATLPVGTEPASYTYIPLAGSGVFAVTLHNSTGAGTRTLAVTNASATYTSLTHEYWPGAARATNADCTVGWCALTLQASWINYDAVHQAAQYTKASDGLVSLRGLIKSGTATSGTTIATLPVGYRPTETLIFENSSNSAVARLDVYPDGTIRTNSGVSSLWISLDNIKFMADQ